MKVQTYLLSAALVGSLGLNAAQMGAVGEARAGKTEVKSIPSEQIDATPAQLAGATFSQVANLGLAQLNTEYDATWNLGNVRKVVAVIGDEYDDGAAVFVWVRDTFTTVPGVPE